MILLAQRFLEEYREASRSPAAEISPAAVGLLSGYEWPGNVRELQNTIQRALVLCEGRSILPEHLPPAIRQRRKMRVGTGSPAGTGPGAAPRSSLEEIERQVIEEAVLRCGGNVSEAIRTLKMGRNRFYRRLQKFGLMNLVEHARRSAGGGGSAG